MGDDFGEFCIIVGKEIPSFRICVQCGDFEIINPETYEKPKVICDPGYCERAIPFCICRKLVLVDDKDLEKCSFPDCPCEPPPELPEYE